MGYRSYSCSRNHGQPEYTGETIQSTNDQVVEVVATPLAQFTLGLVDDHAEVGGHGVTGGSLMFTQFS